MKLKDIYSLNRENAEKSFPVISFEVFPPKDDGYESLDTELEILNKYNPALISVTSTSTATNLQQKKIVQNIHDKLKLTVMPHLTCVRNSKQDVASYLDVLKKSDIDCVLALRGDQPIDGTKACTDFCYASDLTDFIKANSDLSVGVAGYPEGHLECKSILEDINNLKKKIQAGGEVIYTQLFFDNDKFFKYCELLSNAGVEAPVVAGIMPVVSYAQISRMISLAKIFVPEYLGKKIEKYKDDKISMRDFGIEFATRQCQALIDFGVRGLHFYTLDKAYSTSCILENIL